MKGPRPESLIYKIQSVEITDEVKIDVKASPNGTGSLLDVVIRPCYKGKISFTALF